MFPENPNTVVLKNEYYPDGLTEIEIYDYYIKNKNKILKEVKDRDVFFYIAVDPQNPPVVKRYHKNGEFYRLTEKNYDKIITGRTISIHSTMRAYEKFGIVDIDESNFELAKKVTSETYQFLKKNRDFTDVRIRFTGKTAFHVIVYFDTEKSINSIFNYLFDLLSSKFSDKYTISAKRTLLKPNLDLYRNRFRAGYITLNALSTKGLRCMEIDFNSLKNFNINMAKIK